MIVLTVILAVLGVLIFAVGLAATVGKLPGNPVVGLRIPEVRKSQELWTIAHKIAGPAWIGAGVALLLAALVSLRAETLLWLIVALLVIGCVVLMGMGAGLAAHAVARIDAQRMAEEAASESCGCGDDQPSAEECASGTACGSCSLNGSCSGGGAAFDAASAKPTAEMDIDAARQAAAAQDER